jgi:hypothetical protein
VSDDKESPPETVVAAPAPALSAFQVEDKPIADFDLEDVEPSPSTSPTATTPVPTYQDIQCAVKENLDSLIANTHWSEMAHQQRLCQNFRSYMSNAKKERHNFKSHQSSFLDGINAKLQAVEQAVKWTVVSFGTNFVVINATLTKVEENTTRMSRQLKEDCSQLQHLRDNKAAHVTAMQEHCNRLDNMDAILTCVTNSVIKREVCQNIITKWTCQFMDLTDKAMIVVSSLGF